jgi:four helix bundle protein
MASMSLDHERLDAYRLAIEFLAWRGELLDGTVRLAAKKHLDDASQSIANNVAEGNGKRSVADCCRFLEIARGSACPLENRCSNASSR